MRAGAAGRSSGHGLATMGDGSGLISQLGADWGVTQMPGCGQSRHRSGMQRSLMPKQLAAQLCSWVQRTVTPSLVVSSMS